MQSNRELAEEAAESILFEENEQYLTEQQEDYVSR